MSALAPTLEAFFTERLISQRHASPHTVAAYRDAWRLLLRFIHARTGKEPAQLDLADLGAPVISAFLDHLEQERHNSARTRNARLAAIHSFFHYAALRHPEHAGLIAQVLAIPPKRCPRTEVSYLTRPELDALVAAPDQGNWIGRRDHALLEVAAQTGLRVSELTGLRNCDIELGTGAHVRCRGKGRKDRCTPLSRQTVTVLRAWLQERGGDPADPLFPSRRGTALSRGAVTTLVARHTATASQHCPSLRARHPTPHILRHYVEGRVMWPAASSPLVAEPRVLVPAT
jgi:site-specific recombinase XerD